MEVRASFFAVLTHSETLYSGFETFGTNPAFVSKHRIGLRDARNTPDSSNTGIDSLPSSKSSDSKTALSPAPLVRFFAVTIPVTTTPAAARTTRAVAKTTQASAKTSPAAAKTSQVAAKTSRASAKTSRARISPARVKISPAKISPASATTENRRETTALATAVGMVRRTGSKIAIANLGA